MKNIFFCLALLTTSLVYGQGDCPTPQDSDGNGYIGSADLVDLLANFGDSDLDGDGIWDSQDECVDLSACNFNANPTLPCLVEDVLGVCGGSCSGDGDGDGICDDVDTCVGVVDDCGNCIALEAAEMIIEDIVVLYDSVYAVQIDDWFVFEIGADTTFSYGCASSFNCGESLSYNGYDYATVLIGNQCWFAENLRSLNYQNGDSIPANLSDSLWAEISVGAMAIYGEGESWCGDYYSPNANACEEGWSFAEYGCLYNGFAVEDDRGLCPANWHVPSDQEWMTMELALGMSENEVEAQGSRGTDQGTQMKSTSGWYDGGDGSNSSGFDGRPGGWRYLTGGFVNAGSAGYWWSSTMHFGSNRWKRTLIRDYETVYRSTSEQTFGHSVRCVKDTQE